VSLRHIKLLWRLRERHVKRQYVVVIVVMVLFVAGIRTLLNKDAVHTIYVTIPKSTIRRTSPPSLTSPLHVSKDQEFEWCPKSSIDKRSNLVDESQTWQNVDGRNVSVFSAYIDERVNVGGPMVRIVASGLQTAFNQVGELYCQLWYDDLDDPVTFGPAIYDLIYPSTLHGDMWVAHFILCRLPSPDSTLVLGTPSTVSIVGERCASKVENHLKILKKKHNSLDKPSIALCLPVVYGR